MTFDRRAFVKLVVGGVLGIHASPLVFKLMDDSAIWTQNWNWVPTPERGGLAFAATVNPDTGSALTARIINGRVKGERAIRLEGNPENTLLGGGVLPADASALQNLYNKEIRIARPVFRDRLTGNQEEISWETAIDMLGQKLAELNRKGQAHQVVCMAGKDGDTTAQIIKRFMASYGSPNLAFMPSAQTTLATSGKLLFGQENIGFDLLNSDYVLSFGAPLLEGFSAPVADRAYFRAWRDNKAKLVQADCRASVTASQADKWLAVKPGTMGALALSVAAAMVAAGTYDRSMEGATGFASGGHAGPGFKALLAKDYAPEKIGPIVGLDPKVIVETAAAFAKAPAGVAVIGGGPAGEPGRLFDFLAVMALNAIKGNLGAKGGVVIRAQLPLKPLGDPVADPQAQSLDGREAYPMGVANMGAMAVHGLAKTPYGVELLILAGGNPVFNGPNAAEITKLARTAPFTVAISPYWDESASLADLVLPAAHFLESFGDVAGFYGAPVAAYGVHRPLVAGEPDSMALGDVFLALAAKLGGPVAQALPMASLEEAIAQRAGELGSAEDLAGYWVQESPAYGAFPLGTSSGKVEFVSMWLHNKLAEKTGTMANLGRYLKDLGMEADAATALMPHWEAPKALTKLAEYPYLLAAIPSLRTKTGGEPISPYMIKVLSDNTLAHGDKLVVEMNPHTAEEMHLHEGSEVKIESMGGALHALVHLYPGAIPGVIFAPVGLGHSAFGMFIQGKGDNFMRAAVFTQDPLTGQPDYELTRVKVIANHG